MAKIKEFGKEEQLEWLSEYLKNLKMQRLDGEINYRGMEEMNLKTQLRGGRQDQLQAALSVTTITNESLDYKIHKTKELISEIESGVFKVW